MIDMIGLHRACKRASHATLNHVDLEESCAKNLDPKRKRAESEEKLHLYALLHILLTTRLCFIFLFFFAVNSSALRLLAYLIYVY
jgi:hypothetical protein